jgi:hypothetical protein
VIWKTAPADARKICRTPKGCEDVQEFYSKSETRESATRGIDASAGEWSEKGKASVTVASRNGE